MIYRIGRPHRVVNTTAARQLAAVLNCCWLTCLDEGRSRGWGPPSPRCVY